ncbi:hypothetical protein [Pseudomonas nitroreducens]|uniref:hypothetical protein n=1 Tax=Pseudomonas nitroreducens TaxID=46680 RepID=UPI0026597F0E|nr:hypothetical protein [Pseudomonas nitroreducens]MCP1647261.1 hypothetical protein [Pseudomonas nitroreducens]MCP1685837.1 hypothetical protein [Pseudomonas nitroreducens]
MELSTTQIIAAVVILAFMAITAGLAYWAGHTNGSSTEYQHGRIHKGLELQAERPRIEEELAEIQRLVDCRTRELMALRANVRIEGDEHTATVRDLHRRLASAGGISEEDRATLQAVAEKLLLAANTWAGLRAHDQAQAARIFSAYVAELAERCPSALQDPPDTDLIEWLDREASFNADFECAELRFMVTTNPEGHTHLRDVIRRAMRQAEEIEQGHQATLEASV